MLRVFVCSPFSDDPETNTRLVKQLCMRATASEDVAVFAPHLIYPLFLDDQDPSEREAGIEAGLEWMRVADQIWVYERRGITKGMAREIEYACSLQKVVLFSRSIPCWEGLGD